MIFPGILIDGVEKEGKEMFWRGLLLDFLFGKHIKSAAASALVTLAIFIGAIIFSTRYLEFVKGLSEERQGLVYGFAGICFVFTWVIGVLQSKYEKTKESNDLSFSTWIFRFFTRLLISLNVISGCMLVTMLYYLWGIPHEAASTALRDYSRTMDPGLLKGLLMAVEPLVKWVLLAVEILLLPLFAIPFVQWVLYEAAMYMKGRIKEANYGA